MADHKTLRLNKVLRELNISLDRAVEHLASKGIEIEARPTTKISNEDYEVLLDGFQTDRSKKVASEGLSEEKRKEKEAMKIALEEKLEKKRLEEEAKRTVVKAKAEKLEVKTVGKIEIDKKLSEKDKEEPKPIEKEEIVEVPTVEIVEKDVQKVEKVDVVKNEAIEEVPVKKADKAVDIDKPKIEPKPSKTESTKPVVEETPKTKQVDAEVPETDQAESDVPKTIETQYKKLEGPRITGKTIDLKQFERPKKKKPEAVVKKE
ncbi:MAG: translation initiation factor IF-2, partial [Lutibacter sp.]|nr:translation initiation factor IF-2 [Lutibacter sp.]NNJ58969.1 translation initiation factor IF-2 [Lutibacter sp.]